MKQLKAFPIVFGFCWIFLLQFSDAVQTWIQQPSYAEVNPGGEVVLPCVVSEKRGECRWERDGTPIGIYPTKYEWASGNPESGDCSLRIIDANLEYDDGVWQCQLTPSSYFAKDALISDGARLVIRESPNAIIIQRVGDEAQEIIASAGEDIELECIVTGGNPPATLKWYLGNQEIQTGHSQENTRSAEDSRTWISISRLTLPVNKQDNGDLLKCIAEHLTLSQPLSAQTSLIIHYPPTVVVETSSLQYLEEGKDPVTLSCRADSNPPPSIIWEKEGLSGVFSNEPEITFSPVTRHTAGVYKCVAQNALGMSEPSMVEIDVKYTPRILSVGPNKNVAAQMYNKTLLTCEAEGNPEPRYQWLQKLPTQEVLIRGYNKQLLIANVSYDHQGEFVCKAVNEINGEERAVQSDPIYVQVRGAPQVIKYSSQGNVYVQNGEDAVLEVMFCADPLPKQSWYLGDLGSGSGNNIILAAGTGHGRFVAEKVRESNREDCYISSLRINGAHPADSRPYELRISNEHGSDNYIIHLSVRDHVSQESLIAVAVGSILTVLLFVLLIIYCVKGNKCCCGCCNGTKGGNSGSGNNGCGSKKGKDFKPSDIESDKTDIESTNSSSNGSSRTTGGAIIPPDALYVSREKTYINYNDPIFNDSKESLRPDLVNSNLNRTISSSGELNSLHCQPYQQQFNTSRVSYNDLCFPKTSNYGSMKKKKQFAVDRRINFIAQATIYDDV